MKKGMRDGKVEEGRWVAGGERNESRCRMQYGRCRWEVMGKEDETRDERGVVK